MSAPDSTSAPVRPLSIAGFRWLSAGGLVSLAGTQLQQVALPFFVHEQTGSAFATALTAAAQVLPAVTLGPLAGAVTDRRDGRRVLVTANVVLAAVTLAFCLVLLAPWEVVLPVAFLQAALAQLVAPAELVLLPSVVPVRSLPAANSLVGANHELARLVGPVAGGVLYAASGLPAVVAVHAVSFAVAAALLTRTGPASSSPGQPPRPARSRARVSWSPVLAGWAAGGTEIRRSPLLARLLVALVLLGLGEGCVSALLAPFTAEVFGSSTALGLLLTCQAAGGLAGALVVSRWIALDRLPRTFGRASIACAVLLAVLISYPLGYPQLWPALLLITLAGLPFAVVTAAQTTLLQTLQHAAVRGRVFGVTTAAVGAARLVGILTAGYLADRTSVYVLLLDAPCYLLAGLLFVRGRRRDGRLPRRS
jgi:MFS family permease